MDVMFERVAGLDIGKKSVRVRAHARAGGVRHGETRTFRTMTRSLELMRTGWSGRASRWRQWVSLPR